MRTSIKPYLFCILFLLFACSITYARMLHVPADFKTIQQALNSATSNDTILIKNGNYRENIIWPKVNGIQLSGEDKNKTIIDGCQRSSVLLFDESLGGIVDQKTHISNVSLINGKADIKSFYLGGGVYCRGASPQFVNVIIKENTAEQGGGIYCVYANMTLTQTAIVHNTANSSGAGIYCQGSDMILSNVTLMNNKATSGIAIYAQKSTINIFRTVLTQNHPVNDAPVSSAIFAYHSSLTMTHATLWNEQMPYEIYLSEYADSNAISIAYTNIRNKQNAVNKTEHADIFWGEGIYSHYPKPYNLSLEPEHDTGFFNTDRITRQSKNLHIQGFGDIDQTVVLLVDGNALSGATTVITADIFQFNIDLTEGTHELSAHYQTQSDENISISELLSITIDTIPPLINDIAHSITPVSIQKWMLSANDADPNVRFRYLVDQFADSHPKGAYTFTRMIQLDKNYYDDGIWYLHLQACDTAGNESNTVTVQTILDTTAPIIIGLSDSLTSTTVKRWTWSAKDDDTTILFRYLIDHHPDSKPEGPFNSTHSAIAKDIEGLCYLHVQATDRAGNLSNVVTVSVVLDNVPPRIVGIENDSVPKKQKIWAWKTHSNENATFRYTIDQKEQSLIETEFKKTTTATIKDVDGRWYLHVQAKDWAGNLSKVYHVYCLLDQLPPVIKGLSDDREVTPVRSKSFSWHAEDADPTVRFRILIDQFYDSKPLGIFSTIHSTPIYETDGLWYLHVQAQDTAGNLSSVVTVKALIDTTKPVVTGLSPVMHPVKKIKWNWQAKDADHQIVYRYLITQNENALPDGNYQYTNTASISSGDGRWYLHVQAIDRAGNESNVATVSELLDNTAPVISGLDDDPVPTQRKKWQWKGHDADPYLDYRYAISKTLEKQPFGSYTHETSVEISGENQMCYLFLQAKDRAGNLSEIIRVSAILDNTAPIIKGLSNDSIPKHQKKWTWYSEPLDETVSYQFSIDQNKDAPPSGQFKPEAKATIEEGDGIWYLHVMAKDQAGNLSEHITVSAIIDNTPPEIIGLTDNLYPVRNQSWTWATLDNDPDVLHRYIIDQRADASPTTSFTHVTSAHLSNAEGTWFIHVQALDRAGNTSEIVTVSSILDNTPPVIKGLSSVAYPVQSKQWAWQLIDQDSGVKSRYSFTQHSEAQFSTDFDTTTCFTGKNINGRWFLHVQSKDRAGNISTSQTVWANFDTIPPTIEGLSSDINPVSQKKWIWHGKDQDTELMYRYAINPFEQYTPSGPFSDITYAEISNNHGIFYLHVQARDRADNVSNVVTVSARLDTIAPEIVDINVDPIPTQQKKWSWRARDDDPHVMYRYVITQHPEIKPSGTFAYTNTVSFSDGEGVFYLSIQAKDTAGNLSPIKTVSAIIDRTAPSLSGLSDIHQPMKSHTWRWYGKDTDANIYYRYSIDQKQRSQPTGSFNSINQASLSHTEGLWFIHVQARDSANNISDVVTASIVIDTTLPVITGLNNVLIPAQTIHWQWQVEDNDSYTQYRYQVDQLANGIPTTSFTDHHSCELSNGEGTWYLHVQARDRAGNLSDIVTVSAIIDRSSPIITGITDYLTPVQKKVWSWDAANEVSCLYRYTIDQTSDSVPTGEYTNISQATLKQSNGKWYIHIQAKDQAGNISPVTTAVAILDNQSPKIFGLEDDKVPHQQKEWHWNSHDAHTDVRYRYVIDQNFESIPTGLFKNITKARIADKDGTWYLHVQAKDYAGNLSSVKTVSAILDNEPPILIQLASDTTPSTSKQWQWSAKDNDLFIQYRYIIDQNAYTVPKNQFSQITQARLENENGLFYLHVQAQDRAFNISNVLTVHCVLDNKPPVITHLSNDDTPVQSKQWQWRANDDDEQIAYRWLLDQRSDAEPTGSFTHTNETGLSNANGVWYFHIQGKDRAGNVSATKTVYAILDRIPPEIEGLADHLIPQKQIQWSWTARDADSNILYRYHIDQKPETSPSTVFSPVFQAHLSDVNGRWYIHVQAQDRAGNISAVKTVSAIIDNQKPMINGLQDDPVPLQRKTWSWNATDMDQQVTFRWVINSSEISVPSGPFKDHHTAEISEGDGKRYIHVQATDRAGNISEVYTVSALLDNTPPVFDTMINDIIPQKIKQWTWHAKDNDPIIHYRYVIDQKPTSIPSGDFQSITQTTLSQKDGRWFIHLQARDRAGNVTPVQSAFAQLTTSDTSLHYDLNVHFYASAIKPISHARINALGKLLNQYPDVYATIEAHTDNSGDEDKNVELSQQRADYIRTYLIKTFNISSQRLTSKGYGETRPITENVTPEGKLKNRRAEAIIFYKE
ncbi:MAG: OmpA family protein [Candidatus Magnetomorum sp.]|nr:OmpA family protein [Candidatus Magnetomorum sp.]